MSTTPGSAPPPPSPPAAPPTSPGALPPPPPPGGAGRKFLVAAGIGCATLSVLIGLVVAILLFSSLPSRQAQPAPRPSIVPFSPGPASPAPEPAPTVAPPATPEPAPTPTSEAVTPEPVPSPGPPTTVTEPTPTPEPLASPPTPGPAGTSTPAPPPTQAEGPAELQVQVATVKVEGAEGSEQPGAETDVFTQGERAGAFGRLVTIRGTHDVLFVFVRIEGERPVPVAQPIRLKVTEADQGRNFFFWMSGAPPGDYAFGVLREAGGQYEPIAVKRLRVQ